MELYKSKDFLVKQIEWVRLGALHSLLHRFVTFGFNLVLVLAVVITVGSKQFAKHYMIHS
jgi:hypothetical protein